MMWLRRIASAALVLLALILFIGAVRIFTHDLPDESVGSGIFTAIFALAAGVGASFLLRPDIRLREVGFDQFRHWALANPIGQAVSLYVIAAILMIAARNYQIVSGIVRLVRGARVQ